jgi:hypothetical protein
MQTNSKSALQKRGRNRFATIYAGVWALLAACALAYMTTLALQPNLIASLGTASPGADTPAAQLPIARFATDISGLRQAVGDIQRDVAALRTTVATETLRNKEVSDRLVAVEERTRPAAVAEATPPSAPKTTAQRVADARAQKAAEKAAEKAAAAAQVAPVAAAPGQTPAENAASAAAQFTVLNAPSLPSSAIATGSLPQTKPAQGVPAPPAAVSGFGPGAVKIAGAPSAVELTTGPSLDALRLNWSMLQERHASSLKNYEARYMNAGEGEPYQLVAGPISSPEEAARVCAQLKAKRVTCRVTGFGGNAL